MRKLACAAVAAAMAFALAGCAGAGTSDEEQVNQQLQEQQVVDKSELQAEILSQKAYEEEAYPAVSWDKYTAALDNANSVMENEDATQEEVDSAESSLRNSAYSMENATDREHPKKFAYEWYKAGDRYKRDGTWTTAACMVKSTFNDGENRLLVATIANDDASLSDCDVLLQPTNSASFDEIDQGDVLAILGTTEEMKVVTIGKTYKETLPVINVVELEIAP